MSEANEIALTISQAEDESEHQAVARTYLHPSLNAAISIKTLKRLNLGEDLTCDALIEELDTQIKAIKSNDMARPEAILLAQAHTLDNLFGRLLNNAVANMGENLEATDTYMRLALRAQAQTAQTVRVLNELKNPKQLAFIKQANMANGHQQINNSRVGNIENQPNELLEEQHGERLDFGAKGAAGGADRELETVEAINRASDG